MDEPLMLDSYLAKEYEISARFGKRIVGVGYVNSNIFRAQRSEISEARQVAQTAGEENSFAWCEAFLRHLLREPELSVVHIIDGVKPDGSTFKLYGYVRSNTQNHCH